MMPPLEAPKLKAKRARRHISELGSEITAFLARKPIAVVVEKWPDEHPYLRCHAWVVRIRESIPADLPTVIGDIVHNLRTTLDVLACDLVRLNGRGTTGVYFPFCSAEADLEKMIRDKNMHRASKDVVDLIRALKPYRGENAALRALHDMDVQDKHDSLIPVMSVVATPPFGLKMGNHINPVPSWVSGVQDDGHKLLIMPAVDNVAIGTEIPALCRMVFAGNATFAGHEIVPTLHGLAEMTEGIIKAFEALCLGDRNATPSASA